MKLNKKTVRFSLLGLLAVAVVFVLVLLAQPKIDPARLEFKEYWDGKAVFVYTPPQKLRYNIPSVHIITYVDRLRTNRPLYSEHGNHLIISSHFISGTPRHIPVHVMVPPDPVWRLRVEPLVPSKGIQSIWGRVQNVWRARSLKGWHDETYNTLAPVFSCWITNNAANTVSNSVTEARH